MCAGEDFRYSRATKQYAEHGEVCFICLEQSLRKEEKKLPEKNAHLHFSWKQLLLSSARFSNAVKAASRCVRSTVSLEYGVEAQLLKIYDLRNLRQNPAFAAPTPYTPPLAFP